ncbi:unnamed protein product [Meloidogyne enterolobii]|uniref:Uncharacterized protein n=1 Tax=Meloidogyne enterolobii TaxID=390850 RepID=A0ACB0ZUB7_MELEN
MFFFLEFFWKRTLSMTTFLSEFYQYSIYHFNFSNLKPSWTCTQTSPFKRYFLIL